MMPNRSFITEDFLLHTKTAKRLYHDYAKNQPIVDYHCHLSAKDIADDRQFETITALWIDGDHYKYRAMRAHGVDEYYITGAGSPFEKFMKWAETVPYTLRNPLYHWTHLELKTYFGIDQLLNPDTAEDIFYLTNKMLQSPEFSVRSLLKKRLVQFVGTTDDPIDDLADHKRLQEEDLDFLVMPSFRADKAMAIDQTEPFCTWIQQLGQVTKINIVEWSDLLQALKLRHDFFHQMGCRISDHGLDQFYAATYTEGQVNAIFKAGLKGDAIQKTEVDCYKSAVLHQLAIMDFEKDWVQQYHVGAYRNANSRMHSQLGPDQGYDTIGDSLIGADMARFFDRLNTENKLGKTIVYNLNPRDHEMVAALVANFNEGPTAAKMQYGAAWWFLDQKDGIQKQLDVLSNFGLLPHFVGMLTDSRSFMSFPRHDYFRRILCNMLGAEMERNELPHQIHLIGKVVEGICYTNALHYFKLPLHV